ncbi:MAG: chloride channel protein [Rhodospirillaceae bacterium]|nr:chloride channel protein [Rhodospirillaceae bacterium]MDD9917518.1 chloride channel protein [Rhodospirillaceae bacterium]
MRAEALEPLLRRLGRLVKNEQVILTILAALIGVGGGGCAIAFREVLSLAQTVALGSGVENVYSVAAGLPWWHILGATVGGGLVVGLLVHFLLPGRHLHSVAEVIEASTLRQGRIDLRTGLVSALASAISLGAGASTGREGPVVHFGATVSAFVAEKLKLGRSLAHTLLGCGVAAAVAGVFFALEVVIGHYALKAFAPIVIASVAGTIVSRIHFGDFPAFVLPPNQIVSFFEFPAFALLGLVSAVMAIVFMRAVAFTQHTVQRTPIPAWAQPACGGLLVGLIALVFPHVLGVGYEATNDALHERFELTFLIALLVAKTAATVISLGFNFGCGVFSPSLFLGAMLGAAFGIVATHVFPDLSSGYDAYTIVGMGAVAGAVLGAPISTILMVFELTGNYEITIAVMIATVVATLVTQQVFGHSFFTWQLAGRGLDLKGGRSQNLLRAIRVASVMKPEYDAVSPSALMIEVRTALQNSHYGEIFVVDDDGRLHGTITLHDLYDSAFDTELDAVINAEDVARHHPPVLTPNDTLDEAISVMDEVDEEHIAVVHDREGMKVAGFVHQLDVVTTYNQAVLEARAEEQGG